MTSTRTVPAPPPCSTALVTSSQHTSFASSSRSSFARFDRSHRRISGRHVPSPNTSRNDRTGLDDRVILLSCPSGGSGLRARSFSPVGRTPVTSALTSYRTRHNSARRAKQFRITTPHPPTRGVNKRDSREQAKATVEEVVADFDNTTSIVAPLAGVEKAYPVIPSSQRPQAQQERFVTSPQRAGMPRRPAVAVRRRPRTPPCTSCV